MRVNGETRTGRDPVAGAVRLAGGGRTTGTHDGAGGEGGGGSSHPAAQPHVAFGTCLGGFSASERKHVPIDGNNGASGVIDAAFMALDAAGWKVQALHRGLSAAHRLQQSPGCVTCSVEYLVRVQPVLSRKPASQRSFSPCFSPCVSPCPCRVNAIMCTSTHGHWV